MFKRNLRLSLAIQGALLAITAGVPIYGQDLSVRQPPVGNVSQRRASSSPGATRSVYRQKTVYRERPVTVYKDRIVTVSSLTVSTEPRATVKLEANDRRSNLAKSLVADESGVAVFENLKEGSYKITASLADFATRSQKVVEIPPKKPVGISLELTPITYQLIIETNIKEGEVRYAPAELIGKDSAGNLRTKETAGYCIQPIRDGKAVISDMDKGYYNIDVRPGFAEVAYQPLMTAINVPNAVSENSAEPEEEQIYEVKLDKKISTEIFASAIWSSGDWILPNGWRLEKILKTAGMPGVGLPRSEQYRYYTNFEMISNAKSLDGGRVGFVLRAVDPQNYYLVQISGANAAEPFAVKGYVVKNGRPERIFSNTIRHLAKVIAPPNSFRVIVRGQDNVFKIFIEDTSTADVIELGNVIDRDKNFMKGAVGIHAAANSNFEVGLFQVCPGSCP